MGRPHVVMFGGRFTFVRDWARAAAAAGADVSLVEEQHRLGWEELMNNQDGEDAIRGYNVAPKLRPARFLWPLNERLSERSVGQLVAALDAEGRPITHLHTHFYPGSHIVARVAVNLRLPLVHTEHSSTIVEGNVSRRGRLTLLETCEHAKAVFAVSEPLADAMCDLGVAREIEVPRSGSGCNATAC